MDTRAPSEVEKGASMETIHLDHLPKVARDALKSLDIDGSGTLDVAEITAAVDA
jgi:hypothetical protein